MDDIFLQCFFTIGLAIFTQQFYIVILHYEL